MDRPFPDLNDSGPRRLAAAGALLFVATFVVSVGLSGPPIVHKRQQGIEHSLSERGLVPVFTSMFLLVLGLLALTVTLTFLANALGRSSAGSALAAQTAWAGGLGYLFILAVAFSAGAAAAWAQHGGSELEIVLVVNNVRNFAYFAAMPFMAVAALGFGAAAIADKVLTRWVGWGGVAVGVLCLVAVPAAAVGVSYAMPVWLLWWLGAGITLSRHPVVDEPNTARTPAVTFGHH